MVKEEEEELLSLQEHADQTKVSVVVVEDDSDEDDAHVVDNLEIKNIRIFENIRYLPQNLYTAKIW